MTNPCDVVTIIAVAAFVILFYYLFIESLKDIKCDDTLSGEFLYNGI